MFFNKLQLKGDIGADRPVDEEDTLALKQALKKIGRYKTPSYGDTPYPDQQMFTAIDDIQREKKLIPDNIMKPGGETEDAINEELTRVGRTMKLQLVNLPEGGENGSQRTFDLKAEERRLLDEINRVRSQTNKTRDPAELAELRRQSTSLHRQLNDVRVAMRGLGG